MEEAKAGKRESDKVGGKTKVNLRLLFTFNNTALEAKPVS